MNPKISISVDVKNKAVSVLTGMVTVGSKVDVEISGLPLDIPEWRDIDPYSGSSLRFRVVDCLGNDLVRYPLVKKDGESSGDTWESTGDGMYSNAEGCEVNFNTDKLRHAFHQVPFNESVEFGLIIDSSVDSAQYATGKIKVRQWCAASCDTPTVLPDWREILHDLKGDLESVYQSKTEAAASAASALSAADDASQSASSASSSESGAAEYAAAANEAKEEAVDAMLKYPYIDEFGHWRVWSVVSGEWVDHGDAGAHYDDEVTEDSEHGVKSSGIWTWVKSLLPSWLTSDYVEPATVESVEAKYTKPSGGIPKSDLDASVRNSLNLANTAIQDISGKADKADTYNKSQVDNAIRNAVNPVSSVANNAGVVAERAERKADEALDGLDDTYTKTEVDDKITRFVAHYLTDRVDGRFVPFATHARLAEAKAQHTEANPRFFYAGQGFTPTKNDYCVILADETMDGKTTRYSYVGEWPTGSWQYQYTINDTAFSQEQWDAINSGIDADKLRLLTEDKRDYNDRSWGEKVSGVKAIGDSVVIERIDDAIYVTQIPDSVGSDDFMDYQLFFAPSEESDVWVYQVRHYINGGSEIDLDVTSVSDGGSIGDTTITVTGDAGDKTFVKGLYRTDSFALSSEIPASVDVIKQSEVTDSTPYGKAADAKDLKNALAGVITADDVKRVYNSNNTQYIDGNGDVYTSYFEQGGHWNMTWSAGDVNLYYIGYETSLNSYRWRDPNNYNRIVTYNPSSGRVGASGSSVDTGRKSLNPENGDDIGGPYVISGATLTFFKQSSVFPETPNDTVARVSALDGKLDKSGGTMTGNLEVTNSDGYPKVLVGDSGGDYAEYQKDGIFTNNGWLGFGAKNGTASVEDDFSPSAPAAYVSAFVQKAVRYQEVTPANTTLSEAAINILTTAGQTYTLPTLAAGEKRVRDLLLYVNTTAAAFAINFPSGTQLLGDNPSITEAGEYIITMTAMPSGKWFVRKIKMEVAQ